MEVSVQSCCSRRVRGLYIYIYTIFNSQHYAPIQLNHLSFFQDSVTPAIDIYSFGMCALEMAALEIQGNGDTGTVVTEENIRKTIESLDDVQQKDFIRKCLQVDPLSRPSARELLFHPVLFEVHSLKLLAAHALVNSASKSKRNFTFPCHMLITRFKTMMIQQCVTMYVCE